MKKNLILLFIAVCLTAPVASLNAQIGFGVKGGVNLASAPSLDSMEDNITKVRDHTGFFIGPMVEFTVPLIGIGFDASVFYSQKGNKFNNETVKRQGIEIPLNLKYSLGLGSMASVFVAGGPSAYLDLKSIHDIPYLGGANFKQTVDYKKAEFALNLGVGVKLLGHLQAGINYNLPITDSADLITTALDQGAASAVETLSFKAKTWQVSVAYLF